MSALMDALMGLLSGAGAVLDTPGSIVRNSLAGENPFKGLLDPEERTTGRDMLQSWGMVGENDPDRWFEGGDIAGFGAELVTDPLNLLGLGLTSKAAKGAKAARFANEGISAHNAGIMRGNESLSAYNAGVESENAISQAMRAKGALPEELFKDARLFRTGIQDARDLDNLHEVPGVLGLPPTSFPHTNPRYIQEAYRKFNNETLKFEEPLVPWPELRTIDDDTLLDAKDAMAMLANQALPGHGPDMALNADLINQSKDLVDLLMGVKSPYKISSLPDELRDTYNAVYPKLTAKIDADQGQLLRSGFGPGETGVRAASPEMGYREGAGIGHDIYESVLKDPNDPMHQAVKAYEDLGGIHRRLRQEATKTFHPSAYADQAFYALPNPKYIDPDLHRMLTADDFPQTITSNLENLANEKELYSPEDFESLLVSPMTDAQQYMDFGNAERLMSQLTEGREFPGLFGDVFEGGQSFLPYVAPALRDTLSLRETLPLMDVPKMPSRLLKALLAYNAAQTAGGTEL
jgi:hypothetical protein